MEANSYFSSGTGFKRGIVARLLGVLLCLSGHAIAMDVSDNFNDNMKNTAIWGNDTIYGNGVLTEINQRLEYSVSASTAEDAAKRLSIALGPYNADWQMQIEVFNSTNPSKALQVNSFGIDMYNCKDKRDWLYAEFYASSYSGPPGIKGFDAYFTTNDVYPPQGGDTGDLNVGTGSLTGSLQIAFDSINKVLSVSYSSNGSPWIPFGTFGVGASGGGNTGNGNWTMTDADQFCFKVYGYSERMVVAGGKMYGDNFVATGLSPSRPVLVQPNGGEIIPAGELYTVMWETPAKATKFKLKYSLDGGATWTAAHSDYLTGTSYGWPVPVPSNNKRKCLLKLTGYDDSLAKKGSDVSNAPFTIEVLRLTYPNGGETFTSGDQPFITWTTGKQVPLVDYIVLSYTLDNGLTWKRIDTTLDPSDDGSFQWTVPNVAKKKLNCKVKLVLKDGADKTLGSDVSDKAFTINPAP